jgi:hypothetical protein
MTDMNKPSDSRDLQVVHRRRFLDPSQVMMVDEALSSLGEYGEVHLVVEKGQLRFIVIEKSYDALKWSYGSINR